MAHVDPNVKPPLNPKPKTNPIESARIYTQKLTQVSHYKLNEMDG